MKRISIYIILALFFIGCSSKESEIVFEKPQAQPVKKPRVIKQKKGALYTTQGSSLFADKKDLQAGDIIQVIIDESLVSNSKNTKDTTKSNSSSLGGGVFTPSTGVTNPAGVAGTLNNLNNRIGVGFGTTTDNSFSGEVSQKFNESFSTTVSVIIEEAYMNGNYYVKGSKEILVDGEKQHIELSGMIRPYDITPDNTIPSSQIANLKIKFTKNGEEVDSLKKGWGTKFLETIWPF